MRPTAATTIDEPPRAKEDYLSALAVADEADPPPTPWDPTLAEAFAAERRIVHEERLLPGLLVP